MSVALVGAGPGDPGLITVRGLELLRTADVVVHDALGTANVLAEARADAELIDVGKRAGNHRLSQGEINALLVRLGRAGKAVVRLKGGDPFLFGRGGEEVEALARAGVPFEVIPGVTSALAAPAAAGIPVTHRDLAASVAIATGHAAEGGAGARLDWDALAGADTAVFLMSLKRVGAIAEELVARGASSDTPAAVISNATLPTQRTVTGTLADIARRAEGVAAPALLVVGAVVAQRRFGGAWDQRPLSGRTVVVTRSREHASELSAMLAARGAEVIEAPAIRIAPPRSYAALDRGLAEHPDWIVLTSASGVRALGERLGHAGVDARALAGTSIAGIGPGTAEALRALGLRADLVPPTFTAASLAEAFPRGDGRALLVRAAGVEPVLDEALARKGWTVARADAYRVLGAGRLPASVARAIRERADTITFASGGTVRAFLRAFGGEVTQSVVAIGPETAKAAWAAGLRVHRVAEPHTFEGLVAAVEHLDVRKVG